VANVLSLAGIQKGDTVALSCQNVPYFPIVYYGILKAGAIVMPLNVLLKPREIAYHLRDADARAYFCGQGSPELPIGEMGFTAFKEVESCKHFFLMTTDPAAQSPIEGAQTPGSLMHTQPTISETVKTDADDTAVILYTSGTFTQ
jgi:long-chain acyl-CoA synthetase